MGAEASPTRLPGDDRTLWWGLAIPLATLAFQLLTYAGYGFFRDELYYIASTDHLSLGYVEHPPGVVLVAWFARHVLGGSLFAYRLLPAIAAAVTVWLTGAIGREMEGDPFSQRLAELCAALAPGMLGMFAILSMNAFDILAWAAAVWLVARWLRTGDRRLWLWLGLVAGLGLEFKISMLFLVAGLAVGLALEPGRWRALLDRRLWLGTLLAGALFAPFVWWQWGHRWPMLEFMANATSRKNVAFSPAAFLRETALRIGPAAALIGLAGIAGLISTKRLRAFRALGRAFLVVVTIMLVTNAKPYYLTPAYVIPFAAGAVMISVWSRVRGRAVIRSAVVIVTLMSCVVGVPFAKGVLPVETFVAYQNALGIHPAAEERNLMGRLPQQFADMHGWPELAGAVAQVYQALPPEDRARACVFGQDYGQAGAIDVFGPRLGLPPAISGHNSYWIWGPRGCSGDVLIVLDDRRAALERIFEKVELGGVFRCKDCMPYEDNDPIWVARNPKLPLADLWPRLKKFI
jgi:hypothetical protein